MTFDRELFAGNLRANRARMRMTQKELAAEIGVAEQTINNYEHAVNTPTIERACKLADVFGVSLETLLRRTWEEPEGD